MNLKLVQGISKNETVDSVIDELIQVENKSWKDSMRAERNKIRNRIEVFPDGLYRLRDAKKQETISFLYFLLLKERFILHEKTWDAITGNGTGNTYDPLGDAIFGVTLGTKGSGMGRRVLEQAVNDIQKNEKFKKIRKLYLCGRIPSLNQYKEEELSDLERNQTLIRKDATIRLFMKVGFSIHEVVKNGYEADDDSLGYSVLLKMEL